VDSHVVRRWRKSSISAATPWVACDNRITREVAKVFREDYKIARKSIKAQAYWVA
jgi:NADPH-dependent ferric siderophore reductase